MFSLNKRHEVHLDFVKATDFLGTIYRAYEDLITVDPVNRLDHLMNYDTILERSENVSNDLRLK